MYTPPPFMPPTSLKLRRGHLTFLLENDTDLPLPPTPSPDTRYPPPHCWKMLPESPAVMRAAFLPQDACQLSAVSWMETEILLSGTESPYQPSCLTLPHLFPTCIL